jgi:hypothetical protein
VLRFSCLTGYRDKKVVGVFMPFFVRRFTDKPSCTAETTTPGAIQPDSRNKSLTPRCRQTTAGTNGLRKHNVLLPGPRAGRWKQAKRRE